MSDQPPDHVVEYHEQPGPSRAERDMFPFITNTMTGVRNGREAGAWICGHLFGRAMHQERGLRVSLLADHVDGAIVALVAAGCTVQRWHTEAPEEDRRAREIIDVWI